MRPIHSGFEHYAEARPDSVAASYRQTRLTYSELNVRANQLAHALRQRGVGPDMPVGLYLEEGLETLVGMLAILKAGGGYVPLDRQLPADRLSQILAKADPSVVLSHSGLRPLTQTFRGRILCVDTERAFIERQSARNPDIRVDGDHLCYVMFTSGSTGAPKGVMVTHGNLQYLFDDMREHLPFGSADVWTQFHSIGFGFSVWEIWGALRHGGRLVMVPRDQRTDPERLFGLIRDEGVTIVSQTPSAFRQNFLAERSARDHCNLPIRSIVLSGEAIVEADLSRWFDRNGSAGPRIFNTYAVTETGGQVAVRELTHADADARAAKCIGWPLQHVVAVILGPDRRPAAAGAIGELYVGGPGVARGYINDPELTASRFLQLSCDENHFGRVYRTGDQARFSENGQLEFVGRADDQVKLRGYRVELGDIERALQSHPGVREAAVNVFHDEENYGTLVGYYVPRGESPAGNGKAGFSGGGPEFWPSLGPYQLYDEFLYDLMSSEDRRLDQYRKAFDRSVKDKIVLDIGTGEHALLARMCIEAGASRVYAVEVLEEAWRKARDLVETLGLSDRIIVLEGDMASVELPEQVDVCTQGIIGNIGSADGIVPIWNSARRFFGTDCISVPARCRTLIAAVELPEPLRTTPKFGRLAQGYVERAFEKQGRSFDIRLCVRNFPEAGVISDAHLFEDLDFSGELSDSSIGQATFNIDRSARFDGFLVWTVVTASGDDAVDYLLNQQAWLPVFFPVTESGLSVDSGDTVTASWSTEIVSGICPDYAIEATVRRSGCSSPAFTYRSRHDETDFQSTAIHRALWAEPAVADLSTHEIKAWMSARLPEYMVPSAWVRLPGLPLTANGKLDRGTLPPPTRDRLDLDTAFEAPRSALEKDLARLWSEILAVDRIGVSDDFFDLGGDSIAAVRLTSAMQRLLDEPVMLVALFDHPTIGGLADYLAEQHRAAVEARYYERPAISQPAVAARPASMPLSFSQRSFWFLEQLYPGRTGANEQFVIPLDVLSGAAALDVDALSGAWNAVIERHAILRTVFRDVEDEVRQIVKPAGPVPIALTDLTHRDAGNHRATMLAAAEAAIQTPYDLQAGPLIDARLFIFSDRSACLLINAHHIIADGLSIRIIRNELAECYGKLTSGNAVLLPTPISQYGEFAAEQRAALDDERLHESLTFWRQRLAGAPQEIALPTRSTPETQRSGKGRQRRIGFVLEAGLADRVRRLSRQAHATMFMTLLAAFRVLLFRYSNQVDISIGSPVTCRDSDALQSMVGCLVNNVVFRTDVGGDPGFTELLRDERTNALAAFEHRDAPFEKVVEALNPQRRFGRHPLFQVLFLFEGAPGPAAIGGDIAFGLQTLETERASYWDLEFSVTDEGDGHAIRGFLGYDTGLFDSAFADLIPGHFSHLLADIVRKPDAPLSDLEFLSPDQRRHILFDRNATDAPYPSDDTLTSLFEAQVRRDPLAIALIRGDVSMSYAELERRSNRLANSLLQHDVGPGTLVGIGMGRSVELVIGLLATLKTGAAYLPLDPNYPATRIRYMVEDSGVPLILCDAGFVTAASDIPASSLMRLDQYGWGEPGEPDHPPGEDGGNTARPDDPAYVLYTSGSTGRPKSAIGLHRGAVNRCHWMWRTYGFSESDVFCSRTSLNFVDSVWEIFGALIHGASLNIMPDDVARDPHRLIEWLSNTTHRETVSHLVVVPSLLKAILEVESECGHRLAGIHTWITSGEPLTLELLQNFRAAVPGARLLNTYGTSEIWDATCFDTSGWTPDSDRVPIGTPIANTRTHILDARRRPVPTGVSGELYVGGVGLGAGYLNRPELTAERFVASPFENGKNESALLYRTGDLARYRPDGQIECLGRIDRQVKLRGLRMEPGEIESIMNACPDIDQAVTDLRRDPSGEDRLVAWCVSPGLNRESLRRFLQARLPVAMVPSIFVVVNALPLTPSGKVDRRKLPDPDWNQTAGTEYIPPVTETEQTIASIWEDVLGIGSAGTPVGLRDDFFERGGHSLSATRLLARIRTEFRVDVSLQDIFDKPTVSALAARVEILCGRDEPDHDSVVEPLQPVSRSGDLPLSFGQERLWFLDQLDPSSPAYNIAFTIRFTGHLDTDVLQSSVNAIVARHESLHTCFPSVDGKPRQRIISDASIPLESEDVSGIGEDALQGRLVTVAAEPFELASGPLLRAHLFRRGSADHQLLIAIHHIVSDGISNGLFFTELAKHYDSLLSGGEVALPKLPLQYVDFASWQRRYLAGDRFDEQLAYWTRQLADAPAALELPTDRPRSATRCFRGAWLWRQIEPARADALRALGRAHGCTLYMVMLAVFDVLLHRYSGQSDISVGTPIGGRGRVELESMIGLFINTVTLRAELSGDPLFTELLGDIRQTALDAQANQDLPFERLVEALQPDRTLSHAPVFQVMFNLTPVPERRIAMQGLQVDMERLLDHGVSTFDLTLSIGEHSEGLECIYEYDSDLFDRATIERMAAHYEMLLAAVLDRADRQLSELPILSQSEELMLREKWNPVATESTPGWSPAYRHFESQADIDPDAVAVICDGLRVTYGQLERRANRLAHHLRARGVIPESIVGVCLERSIEMLVCVLGVHKAGGAYVPMDPDLPAMRLADLISMTEPAVLIAESSSEPRLPASGVEMIWLDRDREALSAMPESRLATVTAPDHLAYVLFTSGTTGLPKGCMVTHSNLASAFDAWKRGYALEASDRHLQMASFSFDVFTGDWVRALCSGGSLVLCPRMTMLEPARLYALIVESGVNCAEFVPAVVRALMDYLEDAGKDLSFMRLVIVGSDSWYGHEFGRLARLGGDRTRVINSYGTAETTIDSTFFEASDKRRDTGRDPAIAPQGIVPIGRPFSNSRLYICDEHLNLVPVGVSGELCIGGAGVARGYLHQPALTAERFVADPFSEGGRLYRTGDRARHRADGTIQLLGRSDQQVKIRGFRIEPGEIEAALVDSVRVASSAVVLHRDPARGETLVAYVVPAHGERLDREGLRVELKARLPDYMVPALFVSIASLPLTANGKLDRGVLPAPDWDGELSSRRVAPRSPVESALCSLYGEVLGLEQDGVTEVGIHDDFFALGGHSLLATQLVSRIRDALDVELPLRALFDSPTVADLANELTGNAGDSPIVAAGQREAGAIVPASYAQQRLWFLAQLEPASAAYHLHWLVRLHGSLNRDALIRAVDALVQRHEVLRTTFSGHDGQPAQVISGSVDAPIDVSFEEGAGLTERDLKAAVGRRIVQPFDLGAGPLLRAHVINVAEDEQVLLLVMHHIVSDGWSMWVLFDELARAYRAYCHDESPRWPALPVQYADYALWQREWLSGAKLDRQIAYWRAQLAGAPPLLQLPVDRPRPAVQTHRGAWMSTRLSRRLSAELHEIGRTEGCTLFMVLLAAFDIVLGRCSGQQDVVVGTPIAGRGRTELEGLIGFFVNTLVLRTDLSGNPDFRELLARVKRVALDAYAHQDLPFEKLVELLNPERNRSYAPIVQTLFTFHNQPARTLSLDRLGTEPMEISNDTAKFDLSLHVSEHAGHLTLAFAYNADLFDEQTITELASYYESVLTAVVAAPDLRVSELELSTARIARRERADAAVVEGDLVARFAARVREAPKRVAIRSTPGSMVGSTAGPPPFTWNYGALNAHANRVAHELLFFAVWARQSGAGADAEVPRVGLMAGHDAPLVAGLLGILKSGAAYVPLDPELPAAVLVRRMEDAGISALVADEAHLHAAHRLVSDTGSDTPLPVIGIPVEAADGQSLTIDPVVPLDPEGLAYILYTSGTTGEPKGVMQTHRGVLRQITAYSESLELDPDDRLSWVSGYGFDAAAQDIFSALLAGAMLCPVAAREAPGSELMETILTAGVTVLHATPTVYRHLLGGESNFGHDLSAIRLVVLGGETVRRSDFELFRSRFSRGTVFVNGFGLTESTVGLQFFADHDTRLPGQVVPVGAAVAGIEVELLDAQGRPGWYGEITLKGPGVARGYWRLDALTRARFDETADGARVYRTGDIGRRLPDGGIVHVGRMDNQVKVRGYRIELGEIEVVLSRHAQVAECVASVDRPASGDARLVVHVVAASGTEVQVSALRAHLEAGLPGYMLPQAVEVLASLPRLANGKVDRGQLPAPHWGRDAEQVYVPARTELEAVLTEIWLEVLEVDKVGVHDDFFALGGHSLLATRLISRVRDRLELEVPLAGIFADPTLEGLAKTVVRTRTQTADGIEASDSVPAIVTIPRSKRGASRVRN